MASQTASSSFAKPTVSTIRCRWNQQHSWLWQRGGWLIVDRNTGRITQIKLPDFDPYYSDLSW